MHILITGASGQVGQALLEAAAAGGHTVIPTIHTEDPGTPDAIPLDLADPATIHAAVAESEPNWIVHTAAMSGVDACEDNPEHANTVNAEAVGQLARAAQDHGARLLHISTDYVFDGEHGPYREDDPTGPVNAYGRSKLAGEEAAREILGDQALIARTCVVFGPHKPNFVTWCIDQLAAGHEITIAEDQTITPTYTRDLAGQLFALVEAEPGPESETEPESGAEATGTYHTAGATRLSRLEMTRAIAEVFELDPTLIAPCKRADLPWTAKRPRDTSLVTEKIRELIEPWTFTEALEDLKRSRENSAAPPRTDSEPASSIETEA